MKSQSGRIEDGAVRVEKREVEWVGRRGKEWISKHRSTGNGDGANMGVTKQREKVRTRPTEPSLDRFTWSSILMDQSCLCEDE